MLFLILSILSSVMIAHIMKIIGLKQIPLWNAIAINYFLAILISIYSTPFDSIAQPVGSVGIGVFLGILFLGTFLLFAKSVDTIGISISVSLMRLSAVIPTLGSIYFFLEDPQLRQVLGIALAFIALPFSTREMPGKSLAESFLKKGTSIGLALFFAFGINDLGLKFETEYYPEVHQSAFLMIIFSVAFIIALTIALWRKERINLKTILTGLSLGIFNYFSTLFFVLALKRLPGMVVYPVNGIGIIVLTAFTGFLFWKEIPARHNYIFFILAIFALLMIY